MYDLLERPLTLSTRSQNCGEMGHLSYACTAPRQGGGGGGGFGGGAPKACYVSAFNLVGVHDADLTSPLPLLRTVSRRVTSVATALRRQPTKTFRLMTTCERPRRKRLAPYVF